MKKRLLSQGVAAVFVHVTCLYENVRKQPDIFTIRCARAGHGG